MLNDMPIFKVTVTKSVYIQAESEEAASELLTDNPEIIDNADDYDEEWDEADAEDIGMFDQVFAEEDGEVINVND